MHSLAINTFTRTMNTYNHTIPHFVNRTIPHYVNRISNTTRETFDALTAVANSFSLKFFLELGFTAVNVTLLPNIAITGLAIGVVFPVKIREVVDRINLLLTSETGASKIFLYTAVGFASFITMPVSNILITLYLSSKYSMLMVERAQKNSPANSPTRTSFLNVATFV
jgi:hypothetical protein